jgi:hypothetical protein
VLGKQRKPCGSGKKYIVWRKCHVAAAKKLQKINTPRRHAQRNRYRWNKNGGTPRDCNPWALFKREIAARHNPHNPADWKRAIAYT